MNLSDNLFHAVVQYTQDIKNSSERKSKNQINLFNPGSDKRVRLARIPARG
ncbi:hypothetical protein [Mucilaginibacter ginsenosidivorax]|uniref:hypothetical protein n=1 Tax=Mucilaginibacter ginsenosidivorax TaxID=862126 RepID=UPI001315A39E|nr:hypothetical protein [Mucilaginibacter ginsenosidivorax]